MYDHKIDIQEQFKNRLTPVVACIKDKLRKDVGTSNAYDIMAVSQGIKDYQTAKGLANKPFYTLRTNIGTKENPMWIIENLGHLEENGEAQYKANLIANKCNISLKWDLYRDDKHADYTYYSEPTVDKGLLCNITLTSNDLVGLEDALHEVKRLISEGNEEGFNKNETSSFDFDVFGEEYVLGAEFDIESYDDFAIIDDNGIYNSNDDQDEVEGNFLEYINNRTICGDTTEDLVGDTLYLCNEVTMEDLVFDIECLEHTFIAVNTDDNEPNVMGNAQQLLDGMSKDNEYYLFQAKRETPIHRPNKNLIAPCNMTEALNEVATAEASENKHENKVSKSLIAMRKAMRQNTEQKWSFDEMAVQFRVSTQTYKLWEETGKVENHDTFLTRYRELYTKL